VKKRTLKEPTRWTVERPYQVGDSILTIRGVVEAPTWQEARGTANEAADKVMASKTGVNGTALRNAIVLCKLTVAR